MKINTALGYVPVTFAELTDDEAYWKGCGTPEHPCCVNYDILQRTGRRYCVCTAMLYDPAAHPDEKLPVELPEDVVKMAREAAAKKSALIGIDKIKGILWQKKVVVAFSGGLDTSYTVMYLAKEKGVRSVCGLCQHGRFQRRAN